MAQPTETSGAASEATPAEGELKRGLSARHMQMIAIGGAIGTGLFVASGKTISTAGPRAGAILAYALIGIMVLFLMQSLGEMAAHLPVPGAFQTYAARYVSPVLRLRHGLELLVQLGDYRRRRTRRRRPR